MTYDNETGHGHEVASGDEFDDSFDEFFGYAEENYNPDEAGGGDKEPLPDGKYQVKIDTIEITKSKKGKRMLKWQFKVLNGKHAGRCTWKYSMMDSQENAKFLVWDLKKCEVNAKSVAGLRMNLEAMLDMKLEIGVKADGDFQKVYINKKLSAAAVDRPDPVNRGDYGDEDAPF